MILKKWILVCGLLFGFMISSVPSVLAQDGAEQMSKADSMKTAGKHRYFGSNYYKNGQYEDAEKQLLLAWAYDPANASTARYLARNFNKTENYDEAIKWYTKAIELAPKSQYTKGAYSDLAAVYVYQQNNEAAIETYEALLGFKLEQDEEIKYLYSLVTLCVDTDNMEKALAYAQRWGELAPDDPKVREMIGKLHMKTGGEDEALAEMEKVLEMNPGDHSTRESLAAMYFRRGDLDKAFESYETLHNHDAENVLYLERLINVSRQLGKPQNASVALLNKMHKLQPDNLSIIERLADATGDMKWVNLGLKKDPRNGKYPYMMGEHHFDNFQKNASAKQDSVKALEWFRKAEKDPQWSGNSKAMIQTLDPPLSEEEKARRKFFEDSKKEKKEEVKQTGKK
jgi:tetratricopeptide (TPR) repeat protein